MMSSAPRFARRWIGLAFVTALVAFAGLVVVIWFPVSGLDLRVLNLSAEEIQEYAEAWAPWSFLVSIGLMVLHSFLPLPAEIIAIANGMIFGLVGGVLITWLGAMLGAILSFATARTLGRPVLRWLMSRRQRRIIDTWELRPGSLLILRLIPVISFNLINYGAGLARVGWWPFLWTTGVGILPLTVASVAFGEVMLRASWMLTGTIVISAGLFWMALRQLPARYGITKFFFQNSASSKEDKSPPRASRP